MRKFVIKAILLSALLFFSCEVSAQLSVGMRWGFNSTSITRSNAGRIDEAYSSQNGLELGLQGSYTLKQWLAVRYNLSFMQRSHRMDRNLNYLDPVYTIHRNSYLMLPVAADFSFGGQWLRGHLLAGGYGGYWLTERRLGTTYWMTDYYVYFDDFDEQREFTESDVRLCAGLSFGASLSFAYDLHWEILLDAVYYYDITSHHRGYEHLADPRYLTTISLTRNVLYYF